MNLNSKPQSLHIKTVAALAEPVESVTVLEGRDLDLNHIDLNELDPDYARNIKEFDPGKMPDHLRIVWDANVESLTDEQKRIFFDLLVKHWSVFTESRYVLGRTNIVQHEIFTGDHKPIKQAARRLPLNNREDAEWQVKEMLDNEIEEPSTSPWSSTIVLVKKKDNSITFCVDYRGLNAVTRKHSRIQSKKTGNDKELIQSDPISCSQNQKENN